MSGLVCILHDLAIDRNKPAVMVSGSRVPKSATVPLELRVG